MDDAITNAGGTIIKYSDLTGNTIYSGLPVSDYPNLISCVCLSLNNNEAYVPYIDNKWKIGNIAGTTIYRVYYY